jgi:hypothetical protein
MFMILVLVTAAAAFAATVMDAEFSWLGLAVFGNKVVKIHFTDKPAALQFVGRQQPTFDMHQQVDCGCVRFFSGYVEGYKLACSHKPSPWAGDNFRLFGCICSAQDPRPGAMEMS